MLADLAVSVERLETVTGEIDLTYASANSYHYDHTIRFAFKKPFKVIIEDVSGRMSLYYADWKATLLFADRGEAAELDLASGWGGLLQRFFGLFEMSGFWKGVVLADVEQQFDVKVGEDHEGSFIAFIPRRWGMYRLALGIQEVRVRLDPRTHRPLSISVFDTGDADQRRILCNARILRLAFNNPVPDAAFVFQSHGRLRHVEATEVLWELVKSTLDDARARAFQKIEGWKSRLDDFLVNPFVH